MLGVQLWPQKAGEGGGGGGGGGWTILLKLKFRRGRRCFFGKFCTDGYRMFFDMTEGARVLHLVCLCFAAAQHAEEQC